MNAEVAKTYLEATTVLMLYKDMVYSIALTHTRNRHDADDVFQEVFLAYQRKRPTFDDPERRKAWLITTTLNCSKQNTTNSWRQKVVPIQEDPVADRTEEAFRFRSEEQDTLMNALQSLPLKYRTALHLFYFEELSVSEISSVLGIEAGTVKVHLSRGRALMREKLKGEYFDD
jgi:RNA polymerase sigma-70 factor (ECF subfamily)